jgi:hypothetical protein
MAVMTAEELQARIAKVDVEIDALLTGDASSLVSYQVEGVRFDKTARMTELRALRDMYLKQLQRLAQAEVSVADDPFF